MLTQWLMLWGKGLPLRTSSLWTKEELKIIQKEWEGEILKRCASDYCVSPVQRIGFWGFSDLVWPFGQDLGPVGTGDWGLGLGLDNMPRETWVWRALESPSEMQRDLIKYQKKENTRFLVTSSISKPHDKILCSQLQEREKASSPCSRRSSTTK